MAKHEATAAAPGRLQRGAGGGGSAAVSRADSQTFSISLVRLALFELAIGSLVICSTFLPRIPGVLMVIAGLAWLSFRWPPLATPLLPYLVALNVGELLLPLWSS
jgi:hypothetical protein